MSNLPSRRDEVETRWQFFKDTIRQLYISENKTLEELRTVMADEYDFYATKAQFERHLKVWKSRKNLKRKDWNDINYIIWKRELVGKRTEISIDSIKLPLSKVRKELSRNCPLGGTQQWRRVHTPPLPEGVSVATPESSPRPSSSTTFQLDNYPYFDPHSIRLLPHSRFVEFLQREFNALSVSSSIISTNLATPYQHGTAPQAIEKPVATGLKFQIPNLKRVQAEIFKSVLKVSDQRNWCNDHPLIASILPGLLEKMSNSHIHPCGLVSVDQALPLLKLVFFLMSNNFLADRPTVTYSILKLLDTAGSSDLMERLLSEPGYATKSLAEKLFDYAIAFEQVPLLGLLLTKGLDPRRQICRRHATLGLTTPLLAALSTGNLAITKLLVGANADVNGHHEVLPNESLPLIEAIGMRYADAVGFLLEKGARVDDFYTLWEGFSLLERAASTFSPEIVKMLLASGANVNHVRKYGENCLLLAIPHPCDIEDHEYHEETEDLIEDAIEVVDLFLRAGAAVDCVADDDDPDCPNGVTVLERAARIGEIELFDILLSAGAQLTPNTVYFATEENHEDLVRALLAKGISPNQPLRCGRYPLTAAIDNENINMVKALVEGGAVVNPPVDIGMGIRVPTPLQSACFLGDVELVRLLMSAGADVIAPTAMNCFDLGSGMCGTALSAAAESGNLEIIEMLLRASADVNQYVKGTYPNALAAALGSGHSAAAKLLLAAGANVKSDFTTSTSVLQEAIRLGDWELTCVIIDAGANIDGHANFQMVQAPLTMAIEKGDMRLAHRLLNAGADVNNPSARLYGRTALEAAVKTDQLQVVVDLLDAGADPNDPYALAAAVRTESNSLIIEVLLTAHHSRYGHIKPKYGGTALVLAAKMVNTAAIDILVKGGIDVNQPVAESYGQRKAHDYDTFPLLGETALGIAFKRDEGTNLELVSQLLGHGAYPNTVLARDGLKETALVAAVGQKRQDVIRLLLDSGANVNAPADATVWRTALQAAVETGDISLVQLLLEAGADPVDEAGPYAGATALQCASIGGYVGIASLLLSRGAQVNAPASPKEGRTALEGAAEYGRIDMLQMLLDYGAELHGPGERQYLQSCELAARNGHFAARELLESYYAHRTAFVSPQLSLLESGFAPSCPSDTAFQAQEISENIQDFSSSAVATSTIPEQSEFGALWDDWMMEMDTTENFVNQHFADLPSTSDDVVAPSYVF